MNRSEVLLQSINEFFGDVKNSETLLDVLDKRKGVSLRNLEWFIIN